MKLSTRDLASIALFTAIIAVMAQIIIPMPYGVPMTLQTLAVPLAGMVLGSKKGTISTLLYVLLGAVGAPVFAGMTGGLGVVIGRTGGFILSFPAVALLAGLGAETGNRWRLAIGLAAGAAANYLCGTVMFAAIAGTGLYAAFAACVLPFIPTAVIKIVLSGILGIQIKLRIRRSDKP